MVKHPSNSTLPCDPRSSVAAQESRKYTYFENSDEEGSNNSRDSYTHLEETALRVQRRWPTGCYDETFDLQVLHLSFLSLRVLRLHDSVSQTETRYTQLR
jgi:hypothetical protein